MKKKLMAGLFLFGLIQNFCFAGLTDEQGSMYKCTEKRYSADELCLAIQFGSREWDSKIQDGFVAFDHIVFACNEQGVDVLSTLVNTPNKDGKTALYYALVYGYDSIVQMLLDAGADPGIKNHNGITTLMHLVQENRVDKMHSLFVECLYREIPFHINAKDNMGCTAMNHAFSTGSLKVVYWLQQHSAVFNASFLRKREHDPVASPFLDLLI